VHAVAAGERWRDAGVREGTGKIMRLKVPLKEANDKLLRISRGSLFHIESAA